jgi:hypothetical protein
VILLPQPAECWDYRCHHTIMPGYSFLSSTCFFITLYFYFLLGYIHCTGGIHCEFPNRLILYIG